MICLYALTYLAKFIRKTQTSISQLCLWLVYQLFHLRELVIKIQALRIC